MQITMSARMQYRLIFAVAAPDCHVKIAATPTVTNNIMVAESAESGKT
jgi:hypothetical protein